MTTTEPSTTEDVGDRNIREARECINTLMPLLPSVDELAEPIVAAIYDLHSFAPLAHPLELLDGHDDVAAERERFVNTIEAVAALVGAAVESCIADCQGG